MTCFCRARPCSLNRDASRHCLASEINEDASRYSLASERHVTQRWGGAREHTAAMRASIWEETAEVSIAAFLGTPDLATLRLQIQSASSSAMSLPEKDLHLPGGPPFHHLQTLPCFSVTQSHS